MVHTRVFSAAEHMAHVPWLHCVAMSTNEYFGYIRRYHAQHPEQAHEFYLRSTRINAVSPDVVIRVAVADDADPFTDLNLGDEGLQMRGSWVNGIWISEDVKLPQSERKVAEGRILGFATWSRVWPSNLEAAKTAQERGGNAWPRDTFNMKLERILYSIMDKYASMFHPDAAEDPDRLSTVYTEGVAGYVALTQPIVEALDQTTGFIFCPIVAVDPAFQRRGIGVRLMRWGLERAEKEGAPILLTATAEGAGLYEKLGFETLGTIAFDTLSGDRAMIYWPSGVRSTKHGSSQAAHQAAVTSSDGRTNADGRVACP